MSTRREFLQNVGVLVVGFSAAPTAAVEAMASTAQGYVIPDYPKYDLNAVDSFIEIHGDGRILVKIGKTNNGQGTPTSWAMASLIFGSAFSALRNSWLKNPT